MHGVYSPQFKYYRNRVNRERKFAGRSTTDLYIKQLKEEVSRKWWSEVKQLSGMKSADVNLSDQINVEWFRTLKGTSEHH